MTSSQRPEGSYTAGLAKVMADSSFEAARSLFATDLLRQPLPCPPQALSWIGEHAHVDLRDVGQMGGHTTARTHRPRGRLSGAAFISGLERSIAPYTAAGLLTVHKATALTSLAKLPGEPSVEASEWELGLTQGSQNLTRRARSVVLATGGYSADRGDVGLLARWAPELRDVATTNGAFATGDGIKLAAGVGAGLVDMELVQVHPTGFSDPPKGFQANSGGGEPLILCAEILRGVGGVLLEASGSRFVDELGTRKVPTAHTCFAAF